MTKADPQNRRDKAISALGVAAFHVLLGYAFITGLGVDLTETVTDNLKVFDVTIPPPPPEEPTPPPEPSQEAPKGDPSPPNLKAKPSPVVAPPPEVRLPVPPPIVAAPVQGEHSDPSAGASDRAGPGTGAGGFGTGLGGGGRGGTGGGVALRAERISGRIGNRDYPRRALREGAVGTVSVRYRVDTNGRPTGCTVTRSSGNRDLDETTCRLIERRFRYRPARDVRGRPVAQTVTGRHRWWTRPREPFQDP